MYTARLYSITRKDGNPETRITPHVYGTDRNDAVAMFKGKLADMEINPCEFDFRTVRLTSKKVNYNP